MQPQAQIDVQAINKLIGITGKKNFGQLSVQRAKNAVKAMIQNNIFEGYRAKAVLASYLNQHDEAVLYLTKLKNLSAKNEVDFQILMTEFNIHLAKGSEWSVIKSLLMQLLNEIEQHSENYSEKTKEFIVVSTVSLSYMYLDIELIQQLLTTDNETLQQYDKKITQGWQNLEQLQVDITIYRQIIAFMHNTFLNEYNLDLTITIEPRESYLSVNSYLDLSAEEVSLLNDKLIDKIVNGFTDVNDIEQAMRINPMFISGFVQQSDNNVPKVA